jgi:two-component system, NarL family, response regulator DegU
MSSMGKITVGIADDHAFTRKSFVKFVRLLHANEIDVVLEADNGRDLLTQLQSCQPEIILMDIRMPIMDGAEATLHVRDRYPKIHVIVRSGLDLEQNIIEMNKLGVKSFISKSEPVEEVIKAIQLVKQGGHYFPEEVEKIWSRYLLSLIEVQGNVKIDNKERELLKLICQGMSSREIGDAIHKSPRTIEEHSANLRKKFGVANKEQLIALVSRNKIV